MARESRNDAVHEGGAHIAVLGEPVLEFLIILSEVVLPEFDILVDALLEVVSVEEDKLTRHDDKAFCLVALKSLEAAIEELSEFSRIA